MREVTEVVKCDLCGTLIPDPNLACRIVRQGGKVRLDFCSERCMHLYADGIAGVPAKPQPFPPQSPSEALQRFENPYKTMEAGKPPRNPVKVNSEPISAPKTAVHEYLTVQELRDLFGWGETWIRALVRKGLLHPIGKPWLFAKADVIAYKAIVFKSRSEGHTNVVIDPPDDRLLNLEQASKYLGMKPCSLENAVRDGRIKGDGGSSPSSWVFYVKTLKAYVEQKRKNFSDSALKARQARLAKGQISTTSKTVEGIIL